MRDLEARGAALEYWFLKLHAGDLAFLADFIVRRRQEQAEVRLSFWVRGQGRGERALAPSWTAWVEHGGRSDLVLSPLNGLIRVAGEPHDFSLVARRLGGRSFRLRCTAPPGSYNDLGEGIRQTLLGTCAIEGLATAFGAAGLEVRKSRNRA